MVADEAALAGRRQERLGTRQQFSRGGAIRGGRGFGSETFLFAFTGGNCVVI